MIPTVLVSYETLLYVGLSEARATELWTRWSNWPTHGPRRETDSDDGYGLVVEFDDWILSSFENRPDAADDSTEEWRACLERCGISSDLQDAIMDPHFDYLRLSHSCIHWINDTVKMRYEGLIDIQKTSRVGGQHVGLDIATGSSFSSRQSTRSASETQQHHTAGISRDLWGSESATAARNAAPGHTLLFRAQYQGRIAGLFDETGTLDRIQTLLGSAPNDFCCTRPRIYFVPDYRVAEYYAAYAKRRAKYESVFIICLSIPNAAIESLVAPDILRVY
jgi:hypothetical protein